jgi:hypothetical protein
VDGRLDLRTDPKNSTMKPKHSAALILVAIATLCAAMWLRR